MSMKTKKVVVVTVNDTIQKKYKYKLDESEGKHFHLDFKPDLTPKQMLALGVFGGVYLADCKKEFPKDWFIRAKIAEDQNIYNDKRDPALNYFGVNASQPLRVWGQKGWIYRDDPRGWFQWYCRYYMGRRIPSEDKRQIKRWNAIRRHIGQIKVNCRVGDTQCRPRQRQALLHWAYDSRKL